MRTITGTLTAAVTVQAEVPDDATEEQIQAALVEAVPKYPEIKAGVHFDPDDVEVEDDEHQDGEPTCPRHGGPWGDDPTCEFCTQEDGSTRSTSEPGPIGPGVDPATVTSDHEAALRRDRERDAARLADLEVAFTEAGGRGVDMAEEIDALRRRLHGQVLVLKDRDARGELARFDLGPEGAALLVADDKGCLLVGFETSAEGDGVTIGHWPGGEEWEPLADLYPPIDGGRVWTVEQ